MVAGDRKKLTLYIAALKKWSRVGGCQKSDQADTVMYHASQKSPEFFEELESKFGETLSDKEDGIKEIIEYLENKHGVSKHSEIVRVLNTFFGCVRTKGEDLVKFITRFEKAYKDTQNLTEKDKDPIMKFSATGLAVLVLRSANLIIAY